MKSCFRIPIDYVNFTLDSDALEMVVEPKNEKSLAITLEYLDFMENRKYRSGKTSLEVVQDQTVPVMTTFLLPSLHPFFEEFHDKIHRLIESGRSFPKKHESQTKRFDDEVPALVLSMEDLGIGFAVCLVPLTLGAVAFVVEVTVSKIKLLAKTMWDVLTAASVIRAFFAFEVVAI